MFYKYIKSNRSLATKSLDYGKFNQTDMGRLLVSNGKTFKLDDILEYDTILSNYPDIKGFNRRGLYRMKQFYETYKDSEKLSPLVREQSVEKVCFISHSGEPPARVLLILTVLTVKISPFLRFMKQKEFRCLRTATKDAVFGNCKPLKRLDLNFHYKGLLKLHVILGRKTAKRLSVSAKHGHRQRKLAFFSVFRRLRVFGRLLDGLKMTRTSNHTLFSRYRSGSVISKPILPCAKVFAQPFSKGWRGVGRRPTSPSRQTSIYKSYYNYVASVIFCD